ncbi:MAG TPA: type II and III secretion system protein family protein [Alphaproteobacteria bacterium]|nr:type II and III secretion system protein family protein [Alphaproteobacteria bacterium]
MSMLQLHTRTTPHLRETLRFAVLAALLGALLGLAPLGIPRAEGGEMSRLRIGANAYGSTQQLELATNKSLIVDLPAAVSEVVVSQPGVATAIMRSKRRAIVQGMGSGETNIFFLDAAGEAIAVLDLTVSPQRSDVATVLARTLARVLPGSNIQVEAVEAGDGSTNRIVLSGTARSGDDIAKAVAIAAQFAGSTENVASVLTTSSPQLVALKVTVAEVNREAIKQLGININASYSVGGITAGLISTQPLGGASQVLTNNGPTLDVGLGGLTIDASIKALERHGAVRTLAEPTLTAISGQQAEFNACGEFPVPSGIDDNGNVTYEYKEFGAKLTFTPTVKSDGAIGLVVDTSVTEPTTEHSLSVGGLTIPGIKERQAKTSVELRAGETLAIGGLLQDSVRQQINRIPGLGDIPILGALFRSRDFIRSQTELVVLVTPYLAFPDNHPDLPTDRMVIPSDAEAIFLGHIEAMYGVGPDGMRGSYDGSVGFVLD